MAIQFEKTCRWLCTHSLRDNFDSQPVKNVIIFLCCIYLKKIIVVGNNLFIVGNVVRPNVSLRYSPESFRSSCYLSPHFISCWSAITKTLTKNYLSDSLTLIAKDHGDQPEKGRNHVLVWLDSHSVLCLKGTHLCKVVVVSCTCVITHHEDLYAS